MEHKVFILLSAQCRYLGCHPPEPRKWLAYLTAVSLENPAISLSGQNPNNCLPNHLCQRVDLAR